MQMTILIDKSLRLELTDQKHAYGLLKAVSANREHLSKFLSWVGNMQSVNDFANYINNCHQLYQQGNEVSFVIISGDEVIGRIGLHHMNLQNKNAEIGYWLIKSAEGKGIITRSCEALIDYGFEKLGLQRIAIKAAIENERSQAIPQNLGFVREGILRHAELVNDQFLDLILYSILRDEWKHSIHDS